MQYWKTLATSVAALSSLANAVPYLDPDTGFTFSSNQVQYTTTTNVTIRIAVPSYATSATAYPAVIQVIAPVAVGWAGVAWAGRMVLDPLTVAWDNGNSVVLSSRYATGYALPSTYSGATYTIFPRATKVNSTHFQYTALCNGCTAFDDTIIDPTVHNRFAFALCDTAPATPSDPGSVLTVHTVIGSFDNALPDGRNANFDQLVQQNTNTNPTTSSTTRPPTTTTTVVPPTTTTTVRPPTTTTTVVPPTTTTTVRPPTTTNTIPPAQHWGQCGGINWTGATTCVPPYTCQKLNDYYFQCL